MGRPCSLHISGRLMQGTCKAVHTRLKVATFNRVWTALQVPCISLPLMWSEQGLPMGLQLIHRRYEDHRLVNVARQIQSLYTQERHPWN